MLALLLVAGGVIGAQFGSRAGAKMPGDVLRLLLGVLVLVLGGKLLYDLVAVPVDLYSIWVPH